MAMMGGGHFGGPTANQANAAAGLPFGGVPTEMQRGADRIQSREPDHPPSDITFDPVHHRQPRFGLRQLFGPRLGAALIGLALLVAETITALLGPVLTQIGIDEGVRENDRGTLAAVVGVFVGVVALNIVLSRVRQRWNGRLGEDLMYELRIKLFAHFQRLSVDWYTSEKAGVLLSRMTSDVEAVTLLVNEGFVNLVIQALTVVVVAVVLFVYNPVLAAIVLGGVIPPLVALTIWFRSTSQRGYTAVRDRIADVLADLSENLAGVRVITALNRRRQNAVVHRTVVGEYRDANITMARAGAIYGPSTEAIGIVAQAVVLAIGGRMVLNGDLELGELTAFLLYVTTFFAPIQQLVQLYNTYQQGQSALRKIADVLETEPTVQEAADAADLPPIEGRIDIEGVTFSYDGEVDVLRDVSLTIEAGETFAFVGPTGAGKSTLAKLVTRFHDPVEGSVRIDGHDLRSVTLHSLRSQLGIVPQEPFLFQGTVRDNLLFALDDAGDRGRDEAEVIDAALAQVGLADTIASLPDGVDTIVHERGASLSTGERQLLALARAFLARPRVIVLDEATSSLDLQSEAQIESALDGLLEGRTAVMIAHRLATAMKADRIAVVDGQGIAELGSHEELVALGGQYAAMYESWVSNLADDAGS